MTYLVGKKVKLVRFSERFIIPEYIDWLNDQDVNKYMYVGRMPVKSSQMSDPNNDNNLFFAIMTNIHINKDGTKDTSELFDKYIGTLSLNSIDQINRSGTIGYMIGDKRYWGLGIATEAIELISDYALNRLNLHTIEAGVVEKNVGSIKALLSNGFVEWGIMPENYYLDGKYLNTHRFCKMRK